MGVGSSVGEGLGLGVGLGEGEGEGEGLGLGVGLGVGLGEGLGEGLAVGEGEMDGAEVGATLEFATPVGVGLVPAGGADGAAKTPLSMATTPSPMTPMASTASIPGGRDGGAVPRRSRRVTTPVRCCACLGRLELSLLDMRRAA